MSTVPLPQPVEEKVVFAGLQQSLVPHAAQLFGEGAAVHTQVIRQLLPVKGDEKGAAALLQGLGGKVRDKPAPDGLGAGAENAGSRDTDCGCG